MKRYFLLLAAAATMTFSIYAADETPAPSDTRSATDQPGDAPNGRRGMRGPGSDRGGRRSFTPPADSNGRAEIEAKLKEKYPQEFAEIEKLRAEAETKLQALAKQAGLEIPKSFAEQMDELKAKYPKEMAEIEELQKTDRRAAFQKMRELAEKAGITLSFGRPGNRGGNPAAAPEEPAAQRANPVQQMRQLRTRFPKEMTEIEELRKSDPAAARAKLQELVKKLETEQPDAKN